MGLFSRKKQPESAPRYDVTSDPSMTRWAERRCSACGKTTTHKIARIHQGSSRAVITSKGAGCGHWEEGAW